MNILIILIILIAIILLIVYRATVPAVIGATVLGGADRIKNLARSPRTASENAVIKYFEILTGEKFPTVMPDWLVWKGRRLELDGYCKKLHIAVEFSGPLHTKWYPAKEDYKKYFTRVVRDIVKKKICMRHGVHLITIDMSLHSRNWRNYIASRLYDIGFLKEKPSIYLDEQTANPFRNTQLEVELGLADEMDDALKL